MTAFEKADIRPLRPWMTASTSQRSLCLGVSYISHKREIDKNTGYIYSYDDFPINTLYSRVSCFLGTNSEAIDIGSAFNNSASSLTNFRKRPEYASCSLSHQ